MRLKKRYLSLLGIMMFLYILSIIDVGLLLTTLKEINLTIFFFVLLLTIPSLIIKSQKWRNIASVIGIECSLKKAVISWTAGFSAGIVTPGRVGDFLRATYLKDKKVSFPKALTTVVLDRVFDVGMLLVFAVSGAVLLAAYFTGMQSLISTVVISLILFVVLVYFISRKSFAGKLLKPFFNLLVPEKHKSTAKFGFNEFYENTKIFRLKKRMLLIPLMLTFAAWIVVLFSYFLMAVSLQIPITLLQIFAIIPLALFVELLPISVSGIGTRDAALIGLFAMLSLPAESAVALSMLVLLTNALMGVIGAIFWVKCPPGGK